LYSSAVWEQRNHMRTITMRNKVARLYSGWNLFFLSFHFA
jgi:hypothetical protein